MGFVFQLFLEQYKISVLKRMILENRDPRIFEKVILSQSFYGIVHGIIFIMFLLFGISLFYKHKMKKPVELLNTLEAKQEFFLENEDELSSACMKLQEQFMQLDISRNTVLMESHFLNRKLDTIFHDFNNPLTILKGDTEILEMRIKDDINQEIIQRMKRTEDRMERYLKRMREKERLECVAPDMRKQSFAEVVEKLKEQISKGDGMKVIWESFFVEDEVLLDEDFFFEAIENVIQNSFRFARSMVMFRAEKGEDEILFSIQDDGPGFSKEALQCFNQCYYSDNPGVGNAGLGLYIADILLRKMDCTMEIKNVKGAKVIIHIPL
ncbi:MAG: HAMP domain-containing sensor histidine kinase [Tissierellia bacterium]|nr:HAMP domain-containing sensor histidine kinase [Tissierellia bacterium]